MRTIKNIKISILVVIGFVLLTYGNSQAVLYDRGGGLIYDDVLKVTWLQDANYAGGGIRGTAVKDWVSNLVYHDSVRNMDYDDWRLPTVSPIGMNWNYNFSFDGSTDWGPNNFNPRNELSYMFFVNLGLKSFFYEDGTPQSNYGIFGNGITVGQNDISVGTITIKNLQASAYWTGTRWNLPDNGIYYWTFDTRYGESNAAYEYSSQNVWAVRDGDVAAPVPEPSTLLLLSGGVAGIAFWRRKNNRLNNRLIV